MTWLGMSYALLLGAAVLCTAVAVYALRRRPAEGATAFALQMAGLAEWTLGSYLELAARDLPAKVLFAKLRYPGTLLAIVCWLIVALQYTGRGRWLTRRNLALLAAIPVLTTLFVATNEAHGLIWREIASDPETPALVTVHGPWFWVHIAYCYLVLLSASGLILQHVARHPAHRLQAAALLTSALVPLAGNALHLAGLTPSEIDPTPFALAVSGCLLAWALVHLRFLDIVPVAHSLVIAGMSDGMMVLDAGGRIAGMNPAALQIVAAQARDVIGRPAAEVLRPFPDLLERFRDVPAAEAEVSAGERHYDLKISSLQDRHGGFAGRVFIFRDVTSRKQTEEERQRLSRAVAEEHARLQAVIRSSSDGILLLGDDLRFLVVNQPALRLLHLPGEPAAWLGRELREALALLKDDAPEVADALLKELGRMRAGDDAAGRGRYRAGPHVVQWLSLPLPAGAVAGRLLVLHDVTEQTAAELLRDDLTHAMVHDLRNPLTSIMGALEVVEMGPLAVRQKEMIGVAQNGTQRLLGLINAILDVSRLESGSLPLERAVVRVEALVEQTFELVRPLAVRKELRLENRVAAGHPAAWADGEILSRVLQNLVGNAVKFTPVGGAVRVEAQMRPGEFPRTGGKGVMLEVAVSDTGGGIPPEVRDRLFQKFAAGRQRERGSGLGLAFCRLAVEAHGGRIWADGSAGPGATFRFTVPVSPPGVAEGAA